MMAWQKATKVNNIGNDYLNLKWPLTFAGALTTLLVFFLFLSFRSNSWFKYQLIHTDNKSTASSTARYSRIVEHGSIGLWTICLGHYNDASAKCDAWTKETRPHSFNTIILLFSCALILSNLTVFPSWGTAILIFYSSSNRYIRQIIVFIGLLFILTLSFTTLLIIAIILTILTPFYSPGHFNIDRDHLFFHPGPGLFAAGFGKSFI